MNSKVMIVPGLLISTGLVMISLWAWQEAPHLAFNEEKHEVIMWAVRTAAVAAGALAQTIMLLFVVGNIYRTRAVDILLRLTTATVFAVSLISAIALGLVGR